MRGPRTERFAVKDARCRASPVTAAGDMHSTMTSPAHAALGCLQRGHSHSPTYRPMAAHSAACRDIPSTACRHAPCLQCLPDPRSQAAPAPVATAPPGCPPEGPPLPLPPRWTPLGRPPGVPRAAGCCCCGWWHQPGGRVARGTGRAGRRADSGGRKTWQGTYQRAVDCF